MLCDQSIETRSKTDFDFLELTADNKRSKCISYPSCCQQKSIDNDANATVTVAAVTCTLDMSTFSMHTSKHVEITVA